MKIYLPLKIQESNLAVSWMRLVDAKGNVIDMDMTIMQSLLNVVNSAGALSEPAGSGNQPTTNQPLEGERKKA